MISTKINRGHGAEHVFTIVLWWMYHIACMGSPYETLAMSLCSRSDTRHDAEEIYIKMNVNICHKRLIFHLRLCVITLWVPIPYSWEPRPPWDVKRSLSLQWRHYGRDGVTNHRRLHCLINRLFKRVSKKTSKLCVTGLCEGNSPVTGEFPAHRPVTRKMFPFDDVIMCRDVVNKLKL